MSRIFMLNSVPAKILNCKLNDLLNAFNNSDKKDFGKISSKYIK
jgi:hypothetical protein